MGEKRRTESDEPGVIKEESERGHGQSDQGHHDAEGQCSHGAPVKAPLVLVATTT